jgi:hypothetical protein
VAIQHHVFFDLQVFSFKEKFVAIDNRVGVRFLAEILLSGFEKARFGELFYAA